MGGGMRLGRVVAGLMGVGVVFAEPIRPSSGDWDSILWREPKADKSKPNKVSQAKRRKYKRQGRG